MIRLAAHHELPDLSATIMEAFEAYRGVLPDRILSLYIADSADIGQQFGRGDVLVLESEDHIVGCVVYYADAGTQDSGLPEGWAGIRTLAVHPRARGNGFGRSLVDHCIACARNDGAKTIGLHTADFMTDAIAIYERAGFVRCPEYDVSASSILDRDPAELGGDVLVTAYKLKL